MKKQWSRPELLVLYKGRPEEKVLTICKYPAAGPYPNSQGSCPHSGPHSCQHTGNS